MTTAPSGPILWSRSAPQRDDLVPAEAVSVVVSDPLHTVAPGIRVHRDRAQSQEVRCAGRLACGGHHRHTEQSLGRRGMRQRQTLDVVVILHSILGRALFPGTCPCGPLA